MNVDRAAVDLAADKRRQLGEWGEKQACAVLRKLGAKTFRNADTFDPTDDLYIQIGERRPLKLQSGPTQVKTKTSSTYRRKSWKCKVKGTVGMPREEHGIEYWRFLNYYKRWIRALLFVERQRETAPRKFIESEQVLVCIPKECDGRVGLWKGDGKPCDFIFFDRSRMFHIGDTVFGRELLRFR